MMADTTDELLAMADKIGVARRWLQKGGTPHEHFDICLSKRTMAVRHGAEQVEGRHLALLIASKRLVARAKVDPSVSLR